jgi:hypothetical protein
MGHRSQNAVLAAFGALLLAAGLATSPRAAPAAPAIAAPPPGALPRGDPRGAALAEFLEWAHPAGGGCAPVEGIEVVARWPGGLRAAYVVPCAGERRRLEAILETREGQSVWQVAAGFETDSATMAAAIAARDLAIPDGSATGDATRGGAESRGGTPRLVEPPPGNVAAGGDGASPLRALVAPAPRRRVKPELPEEAGRARLIGEARVDLLADVSPGGVAERARTLRGPDPDLGMRQAALAAVRGWTFSPGLLGSKAVRYFTPLTIVFEGLPPESRLWTHRALFDLEALVYPGGEAAETAGRRLRRGESIDLVAPELALDSEWGLVAAADLPAPLRLALHEAMVGAWVGPVAAPGGHYLARKRGEVYYGILPSVSGGEQHYRVEHRQGVPDSDELRRAIDADILDVSAARLRRDYMNEAARLMGIRQTRTVVGQLVIHTDGLDEGEVAVLGQVVNAAFRAHQDFWAGLTTLRLFREQVMVYAFAHRADHLKVQQVWGRDRGPLPPPNLLGEYIPESRILAFPCDETAGHLPIPVAIHESIHMLDYERVYTPGARPSRWFEEGLANYFGFSQVTSGLRIDPGDIRRSGTIVIGKVNVQFDPRAELREHLRLSRAFGPVPLKDLIAAGGGDPFWAGAHSARAYGASWTLVHFLIHGDRGKHTDAFRRYAAREASGEGGPEVFRELLGPDLGALESAWHAYEENL